MRLRYGLLALQVEVNAEGRLSMMGGDITAFHVETFPAVQPFVAVVNSVLASPGECGRSHRYHLDMVDPSGKVLIRTPEAEFEPILNRLDPEGDADVGLISAVEPLILPSPGKYRIRIFLDNQEPIDAIRFYAVLSSSNEMKK
jgi:hypothetical protein